MQIEQQFSNSETPVLLQGSEKAPHTIIPSKNRLLRDKQQ